MSLSSLEIFLFYQINPQKNIWIGHFLLPSWYDNIYIIYMQTCGFHACWHYFPHRKGDNAFPSLNEEDEMTQHFKARLKCLPLKWTKSIILKAYCKFNMLLLKFICLPKSAMLLVGSPRERKSWSADSSSLPGKSCFQVYNNEHSVSVWRCGYGIMERMNFSVE